MAQAQDQLHVSDQAAFAGDALTIQMPARARGRKGGRPKKLKETAQVNEAQRMYSDRTRSVQEICSALGISRATLYRSIQEWREDF